MHPHQLKISLSVLVATVGLSFSGCGAAPSKLAAEKSGDLRYLLQDRRRPDREHVQSCGDGALTKQGADTIRRRPYLQQVRDTGALLAFTRASAEDVVVDITLPNGTPVVSVSATEDTSARPSGAWQRVARIEGLKPGTLYCHSLRGLSARAGFRTAPAAESTEPVRFIAFGDSGTGSHYQHKVMAQMLTVPFDFVLHTGDVAYNTGTLAQLERGFFRVYAGITKSFAVTPIAGNHDYSTEDARPFREAFLLPENGGEQGRERWFSFDWAHVHFVALDTELIGPEQAAWLEADLSANQKPWTIVYAHKPAFSSGEHGSDYEFRQVFHPILRQHRVPLVLNGHEHDYERTHPQDGVTYVVTGGGGRGTRAVGISSFTAFSEDVLHFVQVEIHDQELFVHAIDGVGREFDSLRLARQP